MFSEVENTHWLFYPLTLLNAMKKIIALCSLFIALGFVVGCPPKPANNPVQPPSGDIVAPPDNGDNTNGDDTTAGGGDDGN